jgi:hypothetical protein
MSFSLFRDAYNGIGFLDSPLSCSPTTVKDSDDPSSLVTCGMPSTKLVGYSGYVPRLPHTAYTRSCTINSINVTALTLKNYDIETASQGSNQDKLASFTIFNPGPGDEYRIRRMPIKEDGLWHTCVPGIDSLPWQLVSCQYRLTSTDHIGFRFQWYCDDRDPEHAYENLLISQYE